MRKAQSAPNRSLRGAPPTPSAQAPQTTRCLGTAGELWEAVGQKLVLLGVSNAADWACGVRLYPNCQIPLLSHIDWQAFI